MLAASIITAAATAVLAALAYLQMRAASTQTAAALAIAMETRAAAERQWQPRVIANPWPGPSPGSGDDAAPDETAVPYYLSNDGTWPGVQCRARRRGRREAPPVGVRVLPFDGGGS